MSITKTDAKKYDLGRTGGLTPDASIKTSEEERDVEEFMETRSKNAENRAMGIKETKNGDIKIDESIHLSKTQQFSKYVINLINDVRLDLQKEDAKENEEEEVVYEDGRDELDRLRLEELLDNLTKMETDWSKSKKDDKLNNMPFLGSYKKSVEGRRENPPPQVEKQYGAKRSPRPDPNGYRNPPNRRVPKD